MPYLSFDQWMDAHRPVPAAEVRRQLLAIPVGRSGVAGLAGSRWETDGWTPWGPGRSGGPGCCVKRLGEDEFLLGALRPTKTLEEAVEYITAMYGRK